MKRWLLRAAVAAVVFGAALGYAALTDRGAEILALAGAVSAVCAVCWLAVDTLPLVETPQWSLYRAASTDRTFDPRFSRLAQELAEAADRGTAARALHDSLGDIADRLLGEKYDVDRATEPARAAAILGEPTTRYLRGGSSEPGLVTPTLLQVLDRLEAL